MDVQVANASSSIERYQKLAACFICAAGVMRLLGILYLRYLGLYHGLWIGFLPTIILLILGIGVYLKIRGAWTLSFLLCALLAYELLSQAFALPWSLLTFNWQLAWSMTLTTADLTMLVLSIVFLFLVQYKKNRLITEVSTIESP